MSYHDYDPVHIGEMSVRAYNAAIGIILLIGFAIDALMTYFLTDIITQIPLLPLFIGYFVVAFTGIIISKRSDNAAVSFVGYLLVVVPCGAMIAIVVDSVSVDVVIHAAITTSALTIVMLIAGTTWPSFFRKLGLVLLTCLFVVVIVELVAYLIFGVSMPSIWHYLVVMLFCFYVGYDWVKAQNERYTLDNAVDACVELYLDIINIFIRLVGASSSRQRSNRG
ncbi:US12 family protein [Candidatus Saccharibacteria bacterium]|nr:US12 family protein [Candidatus Saccharibacteria bacterium]